MPYIQMNIAKRIGEKQEEEVKRCLGNYVSLLPGKDEEGLMISIHNDICMFFRGVKENCAFIDVKLYKKSPDINKGQYSRAVINDLCAILEMNKKDIYISFSEYESWVSNGDLV